ncbi:MAG: PilZ domain-containing protein [Thermodesulfobacteriota bacterium]
MKQEISERRENSRYLVDDNAVAVMGPLREGLGHVIELSMSGFSFRYEEDEVVPEEMDANITLFGFETVNLGTVHISTVTDQPVTDENGDIQSRRCGVRFGGLTAEQKKLLSNFIYNNAYIEIPD